MVTDRDIVIAAKLRGGKKLTASELSTLQLRHGKEHRTQWTSCHNPQLHDVIRWSEDVAPQQGDNDDRAPDAIAPDAGAPAAGGQATGRRIVTAQVVGRDAGKLSLYVLSQEWIVTPEKAQALETGERLRRALSAVKTGDCCRLVRE